MKEEIDEPWKLEEDLNDQMISINETYFDLIRTLVDNVEVD
jgi:hypothetical protein